MRDLIPDLVLESLEAYVHTGRPLGGFLEAVVSNDLREACARADVQNRYRLFDIVSYLYNDAPAGSWGSHDHYARWVERGGLEGIARKSKAREEAEDAQR